jgi:hypothetical protein
MPSLLQRTLISGSMFSVNPSGSFTDQKGNLSGSVIRLSDWTPIEGFNCVGIMANFTSLDHLNKSGLTGSLYWEVSCQPKATVNRDAPYANLVASATLTGSGVQLSGSNISLYMQQNNLAATQMRLRWIGTSGSGSMDAWITGKSSY